MNDRLVDIADRIDNEMVELDRLIKRTQEAWRRVQQSSDDLYIDSVALNLHGFYSGLERLFQLIATNIDGAMPQGTNWHQLLLEQMSQEIESIRPAVISRNTEEILNAYRGFRHVVRNVYTYQFDLIKLQQLVERVPHVLSQVRKELMAFAIFLRERSSKKEC